MVNSTVVAWYGDKPPALAELIVGLQRAAREHWGSGFRPRPLADVHATIIGLELTTSERPDADGMLRHLAAEFAADPLTVQFGGFTATDRRMLSRGMTLHERSLGVHRPGYLVLAGWPMAPDPSPRLAEIRKACERFGFRHKYHVRPEDRDPDAYMVLGELAAPVADQPLDREHLAVPVRVPLTVAEVSLVEFSDSRLPSATSTARPIAAAQRPRPGLWS